MAKSVFSASSVGNDGYTYAMRADGVIFVKSGFYHRDYGWTQTKWAQVCCPHEIESVNEWAALAKNGESSTIYGFHTRVYFQTTGLRFRLPD